MTCEFCTDENGECWAPMYGLGPHTHRPGDMIGSTVLAPQQEAPGFTPDPKEPGMGTWWCSHCMEGKPPPKNN